MSVRRMTHQVGVGSCVSMEIELSFAALELVQELLKMDRWLPPSATVGQNKHTHSIIHTTIITSFSLLFSSSSLTSSRTKYEDTTLVTIHGFMDRKHLLGTHL